MLSLRATAALCGLLVLSLVTSAAAAPGFRLSIKQGGLKRITVKDSLGKSVANYYMKYTVTNPTGDEAPFNVNFRVMTDTKKKGRDIGSSKVDKALEARTGKKMLSRSERPKTIGAGESVECVAIFGPLDPHADEIWIDVTGLRDTIVTKSGKDFFVKKAMRYIFSRPGDQFGADRDKIKLKKEGWVDLSAPKAVR